MHRGPERQATRARRSASRCARAVIVAGAAVIFVGSAAPLPIIADTGSCERAWNAEERSLAKLFEKDRDQRRKKMHCDPVLTYVARLRALDMAKRRYFDHVNPDRDGPNVLVQRAGYVLPTFYSHSRSANNVEVIVAGRPTADAAWKAWLKSGHHRPLALGTDRFYRDQTDYGVGYAQVPGSQFGSYWVLISARH